VASAGGKNENLAPQSAESPYGRGDSTTSTPSPGSAIAGFDKIKSRRYTIDTIVKIPRLDYIKGFFMPKTMTRKVATAVKFHPIEEPDEEVSSVGIEQMTRADQGLRSSKAPISSSTCRFCRRSEKMIPILCPRWRNAL
jgi:hypothetical protein